MEGEEEAGKVTASLSEEVIGRHEEEGLRDKGVECDENDSEDEDSDEGKLDISSDTFDPLLALYSDKTPLPYPNVKCFNNLAEYESFLKGRGRTQSGPPKEKKEKRRCKPAPDPERIERLKGLILPEKREEAEKLRTAPRRQKAPKNVLTRMPREY
ncbi:U7 snRNA-associated Sm-like protein LSm11 [Protopterus annectens]|uniref:U7 snRNA-associated Sm-like protein LSm11 n=1 Tax=Protopterus annectens TaxID=7888 RepID=UPI001CF9C55D|nr:U7 snRNA-associated Sm-like protein LSm11 [Protopterus annectens]